MLEFFHILFTECSYLYYWCVQIQNRQIKELLGGEQTSDGLWSHQQHICMYNHIKITFNLLREEYFFHKLKDDSC